MTIVFVGVGLARNVFALHGVDESGKTSLVASKQNLRVRNRNPK